MTTQELFTAVLDLPEQERADLATMILRTLEPIECIPKDDWEREWGSEVDRRIESWRVGEIEGRPAKTVFEETRRKLESLRRDR